jgi:hypothetical protein
MGSCTWCRFVCWNLYISCKVAGILMELYGASGATCIRHAQKRKGRKPSNSKVSGSNKTKGPKHDCQYRLRAPMPEGEAH